MLSQPLLPKLVIKDRRRVSKKTKRCKTSVNIFGIFIDSKYFYDYINNRDIKSIWLIIFFNYILIYSHIFRRNTAVNKKACWTSTKLKSSCGKKKEAGKDDTGMPAKYSKFELKGDNSRNFYQDFSSGLFIRTWNFFQDLHLNKHMSIYVSEKNNWEKILSNNPVSQNVEYIRNLRNT